MWNPGNKMKTSYFRLSAALFAGLPLVFGLYENGSVIAPCDSPIYCYGEILREIELARPFEDSKTFVDMPTTRPLDEVIEAFNQLEKPIENNTALNDFLNEYFGEAGSELSEVNAEFETQPDFLDSIESSAIASFVEQVVDIWPDLTRQYNESAVCSDCVSSFIPVQRPFVVAGGRFREPYYWDSFWVIEGLLRTKGDFTQISANIIENFLDFVEEYGFVPNGARRYYLNRSQPPLLTQMVRIYIEQTQNYTILERALPLLEKEYNFWMNNRTVSLSRAGRNYSLNHYAVSNTQPRPESYYEDYVTATNETYYSESGEQYNVTEPLTEMEIAQLYSNLASGAESGWDYTSRWLRNPADAVNDTFFPLRSLNTVNILPVDLNSILYYNEITMYQFYRRSGNSSVAAKWAERAANRSEAMTALLWDQEHYSYFDYNLTSGSRNVYTIVDNSTVPDDNTGAPPGQQVAFSVAQLYPFWTGAAPKDIKNDPSAVRRAYLRIEELLDDREGSIAATNLVTGEQWDEPNVWPPLVYIVIKGLLNVDLDASIDSEHNSEDFIWTQELALRLAQRYVDSTFCTWRATGGATPDFPQLPGAEGNGIMFEKYADNSTSVAGSGGEYEVVEGFGWSNGVLIWVADQFGPQLSTPECGNITVLDPSDMRKKRSAVELARSDARWVKKFT